MAMKPLSARGEWINCPEGQWQAVCVDVVDLGIVESKLYKPRHMIRIVWLVAAEPAMEDGRPYYVNRRFGYTLAGDNNKLRPFLIGWRGKSFTDEELDAFDPESLLGVNAMLTIINVKQDRKTYSNVMAAVKVQKGTPLMEVPTDYVRQEERDRRAELEKYPNGKPAGVAVFDEPEAIYNAADEDLPL